MKIGFIVDYPHYVGGINYLANLLAAINRIKDTGITTTIFTGTGITTSVLDNLNNETQIIQLDELVRGSLPWTVNKLKYKLDGNLNFIKDIAKRYSVDIISHSDICGSGLTFKCVNWLPDFQYIDMPEMFTKFQRFRRHRNYRKMINLSDYLLVSSHDAERRLRRLHPMIKNVGVLQFVANVPASVYDMKYSPTFYVKHNVPEKFFFCPNQLWQHKNHIILIRAIKHLKSSGIDVKVVFTGSEHDFRRPDHPKQLKHEVQELGLQDNIVFLGQVAREDFWYLLRYCVSLINPSLYEGWSSTVEEAKSLGKSVLLSDLDVHREQNPPGACFFDPTNYVELGAKMHDRWGSIDGGPDLELELVAKANLEAKMYAFGEQYIKYIKAI